MGLLDMIKGNAGEIDAAEAREDLAPILAPNEPVERAFRLVRDQIIFTDRRLIFIDKQGMTGKKTRWTTIPYSKITRFSAETAGMMDLEAELDIWVGSDPTPMRIQLGRSVPVAEVYQLLSRHIA